MPKNKINAKKFEELFYSGKTNKEISIQLDVTKDQVSYYIKSRGYKREVNKKSLTFLQEQMLLGSLLGDLNIQLDTKNRSKNARLYIVHCENQKELFLKKLNF